MGTEVSRTYVGYLGTSLPGARLDDLSRPRRRGLGRKHSAVELKLSHRDPFQRLPRSGGTNRLKAAPSKGSPSCQLADVNLWFADVCPTRAQCLAGALRRQEPWGVWGGPIFEHGVIVIHQKPPGRPATYARC